MKNRNPLTWWLVCSPIYTYTDVIDFYIGGPSYDERDVLTVEAHSKTEAKAIAVKHWLKDRKSWAYESRHNGENPYAGVEVEPIDAPSPEDAIENDYIPYERKEIAA